MASASAMAEEFTGSALRAIKSIVMHRFSCVVRLSLGTGILGKIAGAIRQTIPALEWLRRSSGATERTAPSPSWSLLGTCTMADFESNDDNPKASRSGLRAFLAKDWPYFAMLALALFGVARTSIARQAMTSYWVILAPFFAVICVVTRWRNSDGKAPHWRLIQTEAFALGCGSRCDVSRIRGGRKANDELGRQCTHVADIVGARDVYSRRPHWCVAYLPCRRRAGPCRSCRRLARPSNSADSIGGHCIGCDGGAVHYV